MLDGRRGDAHMDLHRAGVESIFTSLPVVVPRTMVSSTMTTFLPASVSLSGVYFMRAPRSRIRWLG